LAEHYQQKSFNTQHNRQGQRFHQIAVDDTRLDDHQSIRNPDIENSVHPEKIQKDAPSYGDRASRKSGSCSPGDNRKVMFVGQGKNPGNLFRILRPYGAIRAMIKACFIILFI